MTVSLYINPALPAPLCLYGVIEAVGEGGWISIRFQDVTQTVRDLLEKMLFRHHRKTVAMRNARDR